MAEPEKIDAISIITSKAGFLPGHVARLAFVEALKARLKDKVVLFGRGVRPVGDKLEAIAPYKYHLVLENSRVRDYWTEKLADAFLGHAHPIYAGCPNVADYLPADSLTAIDVTDPKRAIDRIEQLLAEDGFAQARAARLVARDAILHRYNLFGVMTALIDGEPARGARQVTLTPNPPMSPGYKARRKLLRGVERLRRR